MKLLKAIEELESYVDKASLVNEKISKSTIGWQIGHTLKVIYGVAKTVEKSDPKKYKRKFNLTRTIIFLTNKIPRGKGKSPKTVRPKEEEMTKEALLNLTKECKEALRSMQNVAPNAYFDHPYFGLLNKNQAFRFLEIHTEHHLKIIRDITRS